MKDPTRSIVGAVFLALVVAVLLYGFWPEASSPSAPHALPARGGSVELPVTTVAQPPSISRVDVGPDERSVADVCGILLDSAGEPLVGYRVILNEQQFVASPMDRPVKNIVRTDEKGRFTWPHPGPGSFEVMLIDWQQLRETFELDAERGRFVELRLGPDLVALEGRFVRGGEPVDDVTAIVDYAAGERAFAHPRDRDGLLRMVLPAGSHRLQGVVRPFTPGPDWLTLGERLLTLPVGTPRYTWQLEIAGARVEFSVRDDSGLPMNDVEIAVDGSTTRESASLHLDCSTGEDNLATLGGRLPPGHYQAKVSGREALPGDGHGFHVSPSDRDLRVALTASRGATVKLRLQGRDGRALSLPLALLPPLRTASGEIPCGDLAGRSLSRRYPGYRSVPAGRVSLVCTDRFVDGLRHYLPFDPVAESVIEVRIGVDNQITLDVERRAFIDLRACVASGREQFGAVVTVFAGSERVRSSETKLVNRWQSYLPPGDYRVVVDRNGRIREHSITVARSDLRRRLRP